MKYCPTCQLCYEDEEVSCAEDGHKGLVHSHHGTRLLSGKYLLTRRLGSGGVGTVFAGLDRTLDRPVAVKLLRSELTADEGALARFKVEAQAASRLNHPHLASVYGLGILTGVGPYIVMELVEGPTLYDCLKRYGPLPFTHAVLIAQQIAKGLEAVHHFDIIHRDLKPANIILSLDHQNRLCTKVLDFSFALLKEQVLADSRRITPDGKVVGTPHYMSPEQCLDQKLDARSDIYSLGVILFEMLAGRTPFVAGNTGAILLKHVREPPPALDGFRRGVPGKLTRLVADALEKVPDGRPQNAAEFLRRLPDIEELISINDFSLAPPVAAPQVFGGNTNPTVADSEPDTKDLRGGLQGVASQDGGAASRSQATDDVNRDLSAMVEAVAQERAEDLSAPPVGGDPSKSPLRDDLAKAEKTAGVEARASASKEAAAQDGGRAEEPGGPDGAESQPPPKMVPVSQLALELKLPTGNIIVAARAAGAKVLNASDNIPEAIAWKITADARAVAERKRRQEAAQREGERRARRRRLYLSLAAAVSVVFLAGVFSYFYLMPWVRSSRNASRGQSFHEQQMYEEAVAAYTEALRDAPEDAALFDQRGTSYFWQKKYDEALADYNAAIRLAPRNAAYLGNRGRVFEATGQPDKAIAAYNEAISIESASYLYHNRGRVYQKQEDLDQAIKDFTDAIRLDPKNHLAYHNRGSCYRDKRDFDKALADYGKAIEIYDRDAITYFARGVLRHYEKRDYDRALADFTRAIELEPQEGAFYNGRANVLYAKRLYGQAITDYTRALDLAPAAYIYRNRGNAYKAADRSDLAAEDFKRAEQLERQNR